MKKLLILLSISRVAFAMGSLNGYCEQGGQKVFQNGQPSTTQVQQSYPQCQVTVLYTGGPLGLVTTSGTAVTLGGGTYFNPNGQWNGRTITINSVAYSISSVASETSLTLTTSAGTQSNVTYVMSASTPAPIYTANGSSLANPFTATAQGYWQFYAEDWQYDVKLSGGGFPSPVTRGGQSVMNPTYTASGGIPLPYPSYAGSIVNVLSYGAVATGNGAIGSETSVSFQNAINALHSRGGGALFIPWKPLCYWVQNIQLYSDITLYSDSQSTCVQYPAGSPVNQQFLTGQSSNVHFRNFTIDGNNPNLTLSVMQDGIYGILFNACTHCDVRNMVIKNAGTDNIVVSGIGSAQSTSTVTVTHITHTISAASCANGGYTVYTVTGHGVTVGAQAAITITGSNPGTWNSGLTGVTAIDANTLRGFTGPCPAGSYVGSGSINYSPITYVSGTNFANFSFGLFVTVNGTLASIESGATNTVTYPYAYLTAVAGVTMTWSGFTANSNQIDIADSVIYAAKRNNISHLSGTNLHIERNDIYGATGIVNGPWRGYDLEPYTGNSFYNGLLIADNHIHDNAGDGIGIFPGTWYDTNFNPILRDNKVYNNTVYGETASCCGVVPSTNTLLVDGDDIYGNSGGAAMHFAGFPSIILQGVSARDANTALSSYSATPNLMVGPSFLSGGSFDLSCSPDGLSVVNLNGTALAHNTILTGCDTNSTPSTRIDYPNGINAGAIPSFGSTIPGSLATSHYCYQSDNAGVNPNISCGNLDHTKSLGAWSGAVTYSVGAIISSGGIYYSSLQNGNLNKTPASQPSWWQQECLATVTSLTNSGVLTALFSSGGCPVATIGAGAAGGAGTLSVFAGGAVWAPETTFALGTAGFSCDATYAGTFLNVSDGSSNTWGSAVTGGGANHVLIRCSGGAWTVVGK